MNKQTEISVWTDDIRDVERSLDSRFQQFLTKLDVAYPEVSQSKLRDAFEFDKKAQMRLRRKSGETAVSHPLSLMDIAAEELPDLIKNTPIEEIYHNPELLTDAFCVMQLHDVIEDKTVFTTTDYDELESFGPRVITSISFLTKSNKVFKDEIDPSKVRAIEEMFPHDPKHALETQTQVDLLESTLSNEEDSGSLNEETRTIARMSKAVDIIHNVRTVNFFSDEKQRRFLNEVEKLWAPVYEKWGYSELAEFLLDECDNQKKRLG